MIVILQFYGATKLGFYFESVFDVPNEYRYEQHIATGGKKRIMFVPELDNLIFQSPWILTHG